MFGKTRKTSNVLMKVVVIALTLVFALALFTSCGKKDEPVDEGKQQEQQKPEEQKPEGQKPEEQKPEEQKPEEKPEVKATEIDTADEGKNFSAVSRKSSADDVKATIGGVEVSYSDGSTKTVTDYTIANMRETANGLEVTLSFEGLTKIVVLPLLTKVEEAAIDNQKIIEEYQNGEASSFIINAKVFTGDDTVDVKLIVNASQENGYECAIVTDGFQAGYYGDKVFANNYLYDVSAIAPTAQIALAQAVEQLIGLYGNAAFSINMFDAIPMPTGIPQNIVQKTEDGLTVSFTGKTLVTLYEAYKAMQVEIPDIEEFMPSNEGEVDETEPTEGTDEEVIEEEEEVDMTEQIMEYLKTLDEQYFGGALLSSDRFVVTVKLDLASTENVIGISAKIADTEEKKVYGVELTVEMKNEVEKIEVEDGVLVEKDVTVTIPVTFDALDAKYVLNATLHTANFLNGKDIITASIDVKDVENAVAIRINPAYITVDVSEANEKMELDLKETKFAMVLGETDEEVIDEYPINDEYIYEDVPANDAEEGGGASNSLEWKDGFYPDETSTAEAIKNNIRVFVSVNDEEPVEITEFNVVLGEDFEGLYFRVVSVEDEEVEYWLERYVDKTSIPYDIVYKNEEGAEFKYTDTVEDVANAIEKVVDYDTNEEVEYEVTEIVTNETEYGTDYYAVIVIERKEYLIRLETQYGDDIGGGEDIDFGGFDIQALIAMAMEKLQEYGVDFAKIYEFIGKAESGDVSEELVMEFAEVIKEEAMKVVEGVKADIAKIDFNEIAEKLGMFKFVEPIEVEEGEKASLTDFIDMIKTNVQELIENVKITLDKAIAMDEGVISIDLTNTSDEYDSIFDILPQIVSLPDMNTLIDMAKEMIPGDAQATIEGITGADDIKDVLSNLRITLVQEGYTVKVGYVVVTEDDPETEEVDERTEEEKVFFTIGFSYKVEDSQADTTALTEEELQEYAPFVDIKIDEETGDVESTSPLSDALLKIFGGLSD